MPLPCSLRLAFNALPVSILTTEPNRHPNPAAQEFRHSATTISRPETEFLWKTTPPILLTACLAKSRTEKYSNGPSGVSLPEGLSLDSYSDVVLI
jgi:hypothetical protein